MDEDNNNKLTTPLLQDDDDGDNGDNNGRRPPSSDGLNIDTTREQTSSTTTSTTSSQQRGNSSPSFFAASSHWPATLANHRRTSYMDNLILQRQLAMKDLFSELSLNTSTATGAVAGDEEDDIIGDTVLSASTTAHRKQTQENDSEFVVQLQEFLSNLPTSTNIAAQDDTNDPNNNFNNLLKMPSMEIRLCDVSYKVPSYGNKEWGKNKIRTLYNTSPLYVVKKCLERVTNKLDSNKSPMNPMSTDTTTCTNVLTDVNLVFKPSKMYLVLGPPLSGKTSLLKAISGLLPQVRLNIEYMYTCILFT